MSVNQSSAMSIFRLPPESMSLILSYLPLKSDVLSVSLASSALRDLIDADEHWEKRVITLVNWDHTIATRSLISCFSTKSCPEPSWKEIFQKIYSSIIGRSVYERYLGEIPSYIPPIPRQISPARWNDPDPVKPEETIGANYLWLYIPKHVRVKTALYELKSDDPGAVDLGLGNTITDRSSRCEVGLRLQKKDDPRDAWNATISSLDVPLTINNILTLFQYPKEGNCVGKDISRVEGALVKNSKMAQTQQKYCNIKLPSGWVCLRKHGFRAENEKEIDGLSFRSLLIEHVIFARKRGIEEVPLPIAVLQCCFEGVLGRQPYSCGATSTFLYDNWYKSKARIACKIEDRSDHYRSPVRLDITDHSLMASLRVMFSQSVEPL